MSKKISVIIPTYKPQGYLWDCLDSLSCQTMAKSDYEVLIVLNGPKESYENRICEFIQENPQLCIRYFYSGTSGVSNARNLGLDHADGEYIAFIDDDDYVSRTYLQELYEVSDSDTIGLAYPFAFNDSQLSIQIRYSITEEYERCATKGRQSHLRPKKFFSGPCMKLIHRNIIGDRRFDVHFKNGEDSLFMFLISDRMRFVDFTTKNAIYYRRFRVNSATTSHKSIKEMFDNCWQRFKANSKVYFSNIRKYNILRYLTSILGLFHIILSEIILARLLKR